MISSFNLEKLYNLLKDFYTLTQIRITVFDENFNELVSYPEHISSFCQLIRSTEEGARECRTCDIIALKTASRRHSPYTYICHAGLAESIMPLYMGNLVIGYLFFGHVFKYSTHEEGWEKIFQACKKYPLDFEKLHEICNKLPISSDDYLLAASHIMQAVASYLCLERMAVIKHKELPILIDEYIMKHYTEDIDTQTICRQFNIGKTPLYEIAKQNYGVGIAEHIRNLRIKKAQQLLFDHPEMRINEIAIQCGYNDYNYFTTVFRKVTGTSPKKYRQAAIHDYT